MPVNNQSNEYKDNYLNWQTVRDAVDGQFRIKAARETYLAKSSGMSEIDYKNFLKRATFFGGTSRTAEILHGHIFAKDTNQSGEDQISDAAKEWLKNIDRAGTSLKEYMSATTWDSMKTGYGGDLVDYVQIEPGTSLADGQGRAYLKWYAAESIYNLEQTVINGSRKTSLVILREDIKQKNPKDRFDTITTEAYRVLSLDEQGYYIQEVFRKAEEGEASQNGFIPIETIEPRMNGERLNFIPFYTRPGENPEKSMLLDLANENINHYQLNAEYRNGLYFTSVPTPIVENMKKPYKEEELKWDEEYEEKYTDENGEQKTRKKTRVRSKIVEKEIEVKTGGSNFLFFHSEDKDGNTTGVHVKFLEFTGAGLSECANAINDSMSKMKMLGVKTLGTEKRGVESTETTLIQQSAELSVLGAFVRSTNNKITPAVRLMLKWNGIPEEEADKWSSELPTRFNRNAISAQILSIMHTARQSNELPRKSWFEFLKEYGDDNDSMIVKNMDYEQFVEMLTSDDNVLSHGVSGD